EGAVSFLADPSNQTPVVPREQMAQWQLRFWEAVEYKTLDAIRRGDRAEGARLMGRYAQTPAYPAAEPWHRLQRDALARLNMLRPGAVPPLWLKEVTVTPPGGLPRRMTVVVEGETLEARTAPSQALVAARQAPGGPAVGLIEFDPARPAT